MNPVLRVAMALAAVIAVGAATVAAGEEMSRGNATPIAFDQLGAEAQKQYKGEGIDISATEDGAHLRAVLQDLEGDATADGLWLNSTADEDAGKATRFCVRAESLGRAQGERMFLPNHGVVRYAGECVSWLRAGGVAEEYRVSTDGVRQDFVVLNRPLGSGELRVGLAIDGATAEAASYGAKLVLAGSGREIAYSRLKVEDATGRELSARIEVADPGRITVCVEDVAARYPVRIDPTFSDADWVAINASLPGADNTVRAMVADGSGNLYVAGDFSAIGTVVANRIAKWNGSTWSALGSGVSGSVYALAVIGSDVYAGGGFNTAGGTVVNRIAKWNGTAWTSIGGGMNGDVYALAASGSNLYAGGNFTTAGGVSANRIGKWNGSAWSALGSGMSDVVNALIVSGNDLYAGGNFTTAGGTSAVRIAKWDGSAWSALGSGMNSSVNALTTMGGELYAGGDFTTAGGASITRIAKWSGSAWSPLGSGMNNTVYALIASGSNLYAGGLFSTAGGATAGRIASWNGSAWSAVGSGHNSQVNALAIFGSDLYAGGNFTTAGGTTAMSIAKWNGSTWSAIGTGMNNILRALVVSGGDLYAAGDFTSAGATITNRIVKWNGSVWTPLGSGMNDIVYVLTTIGSDLYAGGQFTTADGAATGRIAKWNGSAWSALGSGLNGTVDALAVSGSDLYVGGTFTTAGGLAANRVAKWNGSAWSPLGSGMNSNVLALAVNGSDLYAGGIFTSAGGVSATRIAKWNGSTWSALGSGISSEVYALAMIGNDLFAGGTFVTAGGITVNRVAKWNGSAWSALGSGLASSGQVNALAVIGNDLYAGGGFTSFGGANHIAKWDGSAWSALGSGMNNGVNALATDDKGHLFAGGNFTVAGTTFSPYLAQANADKTDPNTSITGSPPSPTRINFATITFTGSDNVVAPANLTFEGRLDGAAFAMVTSPVNLSGLSDGTHTYEVRARDVLGNVDATPASVTWVVEPGTQAPNLTAPGNNTVTASPVNVSFTLPEAALPGSVKLNFGATPLTLAASQESIGSHSFTFNPANPTASPQIADGNLIADGVYTVTLSYHDALGNPAASAAVTNVTIDTTGPVLSPVSIASNNPNPAWAKLGNTVTVSFTANEPIQTPVVTLLGVASSVANPNGNQWTATATASAGTVEGTGAFTISATDALGNAAGAVTATTDASLVKVDKTAPVIETPSNLTAGATSVGGAVVSFMPSVSDNLDPSPVLLATPASGSTFPIGSTPVTLTLTDAAGNTATANFTVTVENRTHEPAFTQADTIPLTADEFDPTGLSVGPLTLGFSPAPGQVLTLVNNTSANPIGGVFADLSDGSTVAASFGGRNLLFQASYSGGDGNDITLTLLDPEIVVQQPVGTEVTDGGTRAIQSVMGATTSLTFTVRNTGPGILNGVSITKSGSDAGLFAISQAPASSLNGPTGSTTFIVDFNSGTSGLKLVVLHIASDDADENPFDITLNARALSPAEDTDGDGLNDAAEFLLATLGYDWQVSQPALVNTLMSQAGVAGLFTQAQFDANRVAGRNDILNAPNNHGLYTQSQLQGLNVGAPLLAKDPQSGRFKLTLGLDKSTTLLPGSFVPLPMTEPDTSINGLGELEFEFAVPDNAAFFRVRAK